MKYLHPDVLEVVSTYLRTNAVRALVVPFFTTDYAQAVGSALATATISSSDFSISYQDGVNSLVFSGATVQTTGGIPFSSNVHVAFTDGAARVLWVESLQPTVILAGQTYILPAQTLISPQPIEG